MLNIYSTFKKHKAMKVVETLFNSHSGYDSKNITNKSGKRVPQVHLDAIERGVTSEELEAMAKAGLKIFRYKTQITIHGLFPELGNNRIGGYTNLFQNKNQSIGVKYNAIDEQKRARIAEKLKYIGLKYSRDSNGCKYTLAWEVNKSNWDEKRDAIFALKAKIDTSLFTGNVYVQKGQAWGITYLCLTLEISIIPESNVQRFIDSLVSESDIEAVIAKEKQDADEREKYWEEHRKAVAEKQAQAVKAAQPFIDHLKTTYKQIPKTADCGTYLEVGTNYKDEIEFTVMHIYMPKGAKKPRYNNTGYPDMQQALAHVPTARYSDSIFNGFVKNVFKIA